MYRQVLIGNTHLVEKGAVNENRSGGGGGTLCNERYFRARLATLFTRTALSVAFNNSIYSTQHTYCTSSSCIPKYGCTDLLFQQAYTFINLQHSSHLQIPSNMLQQCCTYALLCSSRTIRLSLSYLISIFLLPRPLAFTPDGMMIAITTTTTTTTTTTSSGSTTTR